MSEHNDVLQVQGINSKGFGTVAKLVMQDRRLTPQAKGIYGYFCSYAGAGRQAFPSRSRIIADMAMSKDSYYKHFSGLKKYGYIKVEQEKDKAGQFRRNIYTLMEFLPCPRNPDTVKKRTVPCPNLPDTAEPDTVKQDTNINRFKNKQFLKIISQSSQSDPDGQDGTEYNTLEAYIGLIEDNISYSDFQLARPHDMKLLDEFIAVILDALLSKCDTITVGGERKPRTLVRHNLMQLAYEDMEHVIDQFKSVTEPIKRKRQYMLTMLYNCRMEREAHVTNLFESNNHKPGKENNQ